MAAWVDTGFLVALFARDDKHHASSVSFLRANQRLTLHSLWPVVSEASFFLNTKAKLAMLEWVESTEMIFHELTSADLPAIRATLKKYSTLDPDFTDAALVTLANMHRIDQIVTVDLRDFSAYRVNGKPFNRLWL